MNAAAQALGRLARGKPKTLTPAQREQRRQQMNKAREIRLRRLNPIGVTVTGPVCAKCKRSGTVISGHCSYCGHTSQN